MSDPAPAASTPAPAASAPSAPAATPAQPAAPAAVPAPATAAVPAASTPAAQASPAAPTQPDPNAQTAAAKAAADAQAKAAQGAPEKYEPFTAPEGTMLNDGVMGKFQGVAKELNLSQEKAQTLVSKLAPVITARQTDHITETLAKADAEWTAAVAADPEIGGTNQAANVAVAKRAIDTFGTPAFKQFLNDSRLGNHPEWVRFAYRAGKAISPDGTHVAGSEPGQGQKSLEARLWPPTP